jgi:hypothetical protein
MAGENADHASTCHHGFGRGIPAMRYQARRSATMAQMYRAAQLQRLRAHLDDRVPARYWILIVSLIAACWLVPAVMFSIPTNHVDWLIYRDAATRWLTTGSPYETLGTNWNPNTQFPYIYPPSSWPLLLLALVLPAPLLLVAYAPFLVQRPRLAFAPLVAFFLALSFGPAFYWGNVNILVAALIVLTALPGAAGGVALAVAVALKGYPIVLLPLFWRDRRRTQAFVVAFVSLAVVGTVVFGPDSWIQWVRSLLGEGEMIGQGNLTGPINPLLPLGSVRYLVAGLIAGAGLCVASPTLALVGVTLLFQGVSVHYLLTFAAAAMIEPALRSRRFGLPPAPYIRQPRARGRQPGP